MKPASLHAFSGELRRAGEIAQRLGAPCHEIDVHAFPDGETRVTAINPSSTAVLYATLSHPNEKIFPLLLAADALRRAGAENLALVAPYLCYMRQDKEFAPGQAVSQKVIGRLLAAHFNRIITVEAHLHRTHDIRDVFPGIHADNLSAARPIADFLRNEAMAENAVIAGPDEESASFVSVIARKLGCAHAVGKKQRFGDRSVEIAFDEKEKISGKAAVIVDDIVSSGGTILKAAKALKEAGAVSINVVTVHALFPKTMIAEFERAGIGSVSSTFSVPHATNAIPLDALLAEALLPELGS